MNANFKEIDKLTVNPFDLMKKDTFLLSVKQGEKTNAMRCGWGMLGVLWGVDVAAVFVRPSRYTYGMMEEEDTFSLCFFDREFKEEVEYFGKVSARQEDKMQKTGLTLSYEQDIPYFHEARLVILCQKIYRQDLDPTGFVNFSAEPFYRSGDYHKTYVGRILKILEKAQ
ncbi:hypothetical protein SDC9_162148 [bioreactor metagenome]|uniref:Flavin reductase like domain-containing protein n=1 Tax=bioreactor metagenome TaxID=1076179 RepID=A0A645FNA1_9ZZZZ